MGMSGDSLSFSSWSYLLDLELKKEILWVEWPLWWWCNDTKWKIIKNLEDK